MGKYSEPEEKGITEETPIVEEVEPIVEAKEETLIPEQPTPVAIHDGVISRQ